jgi:glucose-6-phosphate 1-dehydrogenase
MIERLVLFGATGDLAGRFLLPALAALRASDALPEQFEIIGVARAVLGDDGFKGLAAERLKEHAADVSPSARQELVQSLRYHQVDLEDPGSLRSAFGPSSGPIATYLALPPAVFPVAVATLGAAGLPDGSRIVLEKPFGEDLASAVALNRLLAQVAESEQAVFRVDHVLGLATVQNLIALRFANRILEPLWSSSHVEQVSLLWEETLALEGRAGYYDTAGALRDVVQNHLLQVLCLIAMEPPASLGEPSLHDRKVDLLRAIRPLDPGDMTSHTRRARYTAGEIDGRAIPSYAEEEGVDPTRGTETFAELSLQIENERWAGTRFVLRAGKALIRRRKEAIVRFRPTTGTPFSADTMSGERPNELEVGLDGPDHLALRLTGGIAGTLPRPTPLVLATEPPATALPAYARVLLDVLGGGSSLSVRGDEAEESWRILTPVVQAWAEEAVPLEEYRAGSTGPPPPKTPS